jgi:hypothetical protein
MVADKLWRIQMIADTNDDGYKWTVADTNEGGYSW